MESTAIAVLLILGVSVSIHTQDVETS